MWDIIQHRVTKFLAETLPMCTFRRNKMSGVCEAAIQKVNFKSDDKYVETMTD